LKPGRGKTFPEVFRPAGGKTPTAENAQGGHATGLTGASRRKFSMQKGSPRNLGDLAGDLFRSRQKQPHLTVTLLRKHWAGIVGAELARKTHPARIAGNTLWINALDSSWAFQLQFLKEEILPAIQVFLSSAAISDLRFKAGAVPESAQKAEKAPPPPATVVEDSVEDTVEDAVEHAAETAGPAQKIADKIADPTLRKTFARWLARQKSRPRPDSTSGR